MKLSEYLDGMGRASTADELEAAVQAPHKHFFIGKTWSRISNVRIAEGKRICDAHPNGRFVPRFGPHRRLTVCGESYRVWIGGNSTGVRYAWTYAQEWAEGVLRDNGFSMRAAHAVYEWAFEYPHRALRAVENALAGKLPDPPFGVLLPHDDREGGRPVRVDRAADAEERAHRACECGDGWLWDWGCGWCGYANFINWHCDRCPRVFTEYVTNERLHEIRSRKEKAE